MADYLATVLVRLSDHSWQHKEFDKRVKAAAKAGFGCVNVNYDILFSLREQPDPKHWFRIIEWQGWRIFLPNKNGLSLRREMKTDYLALCPQADEASLADFISVFIT